MNRIIAFTQKCLTGYLVLLGGMFFLLSLIPSLSFLLLGSAICYWLVFTASFHKLNPRNIKQISVLLFIGFIALICLLFLAHKPITWSQLLAGNINIVSMLIGVSLLSLLPSNVKADSKLTGQRGVISTWSSVHLLGAVINMSSPFLVGDRLQQLGKLSPSQLSVLIRALTSAGFWSPFFASMGIALSIAPQAKYHSLVLIGIPIAILACFISVNEFKRHNQLSSFVGLPLAVDSLKFPVFLATMVLLFHYYITPNLMIIAIVTLLSPLCVICLLMYQQGMVTTTNKLHHHCTNRLPKMANEISLFIAAGFMTSAIDLLVSNIFGSQWSLFESFGFWQSILCYFAIILTALLGVHPIVGISIMSSVVPYAQVNNTLLAFVSISAWGVGTAIGPLSGINLSIGGKYDVDNYHLAHANLQYGAIMSVGIVIAFYALSLIVSVP